MRGRDLLTLGALALGYALSHQLGFRFMSRTAGVAAVWPASGVGLAALLLTAPRLRPSLLAVLGAISLLSNLWTGASLGSSAGYAFSNVLELVLATWLISRRARTTLDRVRNLVELLVFACLSTALGALIGAFTTTQYAAVAFGTAYVTWWVSDSLGIVLVTPLLLAFAQDPLRASALRSRRGLEAAAFFACWCSAGWLAFHADRTEPLALRPYALLALLAWAALRLGQRGVSVALAILAVLAIGSATSGAYSAVLGSLDPTEQLLSVQVYLGITAATGLLLAASATETHAAEQQARAGQAQLRALADTQRLAEHASQRAAERLQFALKAARMGTWEWNQATGEVHWSDQVEGMFGLPKGTFPGTFAAYTSLIHPDDRERVVSAIEVTAQGELKDFAVEHRVIWPDGSLHWVEGRGRVHRDDESGPTA